MNRVAGMTIGRSPKVGRLSVAGTAHKDANDLRARCKAIKALGGDSCSSPEAISQLKKLLGDRSTVIRSHAAYSLSRIGKMTLSALLKPVRSIYNKQDGAESTPFFDQSVQHYFIETKNDQLCIFTERFVATLKDAIDRGDAVTEIAMRRILLRVKEMLPFYLPALLYDKNPRVREAAAEILGHAVTQTEDTRRFAGAQDDLENCRNDADDRVRRAAKWAIHRIKNVGAYEV